MTTNLPAHALPPSRQWLLVSLATLCGLVAAYNIGKVPPSVVALREEFNTSLTWIAALVSSYSLVAMTCSLLMGSVVGFLGLWRTTVLGLLCLAVGGVLGAVTNYFSVLLAARVVEGLGYIAIAVSMPAFITRVCAPSNRPVAMGIWGTFVPAGVTLCMLVAPALSSIGGWRLLWWVGVGCALIMLLTASLLMRPVLANENKPSTGTRLKLRTVVNQTSVILMICFAIYSMLFTGVTTFLPTYWSEVKGLPLDVAIKWTALVVAMNIVGNLVGGLLNSTGIKVRNLLLLAVAVGGLFAVAVYTTSMPFGLQLAAGCAFSLFSGIAPATLFTTVAKITSSPAQNGLLVGLLFQGAGIGQVAGPLLFGAIIDATGGWWLAPFYFLGCVGMVILLLSRLTTALKPL